MATTTTVTSPVIFAPLADQSGPVVVPEPEPIDRAEHFVRLPTVRTLTANLVVVGRLKPLPLPDLED